MGTSDPTAPPDSSPDAGSPHTEIVTKLLDGRVSAGPPVVSPDGRRIAFPVSTIDLAENTVIVRIWLAGADIAPAPVTAGPLDGAPVWSPDGRWLAFTSSRGDKKGESTLHVMPADGPGEVRTVVAMPDGISD
ncbi:MAG: hypothetical protein ABW122_15765, partial [Ilumatobacteraceae bacterium]